MTFLKTAWILIGLSLPAFSSAAAADDSTNTVNQTSSPSSTLPAAQDLIVPDKTPASQTPESEPVAEPQDETSYAIRLRTILKDPQSSSESKIAQIKDLEKTDSELIVGNRSANANLEPAFWIVVARAVRGEDPGLKVLRFFLRNGADVNAGKSGRTVLRLAAFPQPYSQDMESEENMSAPPARQQIVKLLLEYGAFPGIADRGADPHQFMASEDTSVAREIQSMIDDALTAGPEQASVRREIKLQTLLEEAQNNGDAVQAANLQRALDRTKESKERFLTPIDLTQDSAIRSAIGDYLKNRVDGNSKSATVNKLEFQRRVVRDGNVQEWVVGTISLKTLQLVKIPKIGPVGGHEDVFWGDRQEWPVSFEFNLATGEGCQTLSHTVGHGPKARDISVSTWQIRNIILPHLAELETQGWQ